MTKAKNLAATTNNNQLYNKAVKRAREADGSINCGLCPYNKGENSGYYTMRSWKRYRAKQYKVKRYIVENQKF